MEQPKFRIGQKVTVRESHSSVLRDAEVSRYANRVGVVLNYHYISPNWGKVFYIYSVKIGEDEKEIVLHEDEIQ